MATSNRLFIDKLHINSESEDFIKEFNKLADKLETFSSTISIWGNTRSQLLKKVEIEANSSVKLTHSLGSRPVYRLILKQTSGGVLLDGEWNDKTVEFKHGSGTFKGTILLLGGE